MAKVFDYCPADKFEGDDGCAGCPALPGTEHCEAVFMDVPKVRVWYRGRPWQWWVFKPLHGHGYRAFWFGLFKIVIWN